MLTRPHCPVCSSHSPVPLIPARSLLQISWRPRHRYWGLLETSEGCWTPRSWTQNQGPKALSSLTTTM